MKNARITTGNGREAIATDQGALDVQLRKTIRLDTYTLDGSDNDRLVVAGRITGFDDIGSNIALHGDFQVTELLEGINTQAPRLIVPRNAYTVALTEEFEQALQALFFGYKITGDWRWQKML